MSLKKAKKESSIAFSKFPETLFFDPKLIKLLQFLLMNV